MCQSSNEFYEGKLIKMGCGASKFVDNDSESTGIVDQSAKCDHQNTPVTVDHRHISSSNCPAISSNHGGSENGCSLIKDDQNIYTKEHRAVMSTKAHYNNGIKNRGKGFYEESLIMKGLKDERETAKSDVGKHDNKFVILHFNDVYNVEPREKEPVGGAARFATKLASFKSRNPLIFFSGDALNPSMMSSVTKGEQMLPVLNCLGIHAGVYGNHDFDFGVDELVDFAGDCNFPWLMSNVYDKNTQRPLADGAICHVLEWNGHKLGVIGLVEKEWLVTLATLTIEEVDYIDFVAEGQRLSSQLREGGCDFIIALTHMRMPNDVKLAENVPGIDLILGGHDHHYEIKEINGIKIFKSGSDFRCFSEIEVIFGNNGSYTIESQKHVITKDILEDPEIKMVVDKYIDIVEEKMEGVLGKIEVELDGRFVNIRTKETNLGNLIADITRNVTHADIGLINSGTLRSDMIHPAGEFKMKDLFSILPMPDPVVVLRLSGAQLLIALNNGVSQWPKHEGRFPQVSGVTFAFDPDLPPGDRVIKDSVTIAGKNVDMEKKYTLCTKGYIGSGKDGYDVFKDCEILVSQEEGTILPTIVRNHFVSCNIVKGLQMCRSGHRQSITVLEPGEQLSELEKRKCTISPKVEGRVRVVYQQQTGKNGF